MLLRTRGKPSNIYETIVGSVTHDYSDFGETSIFIQETKNSHEFIKKPLCILTDDFLPGNSDIAVVYSIPQLSHLNEGDIVSIDAQGNINTLYRINSRHNSLLVTEMCNSNCLMCSQPPKLKDDREYLFNIHKKLIPLIPKSCSELGITGGEPTLLDNLFFELLSLLKYELPETEIHVLSNGRKFAWNDFTKRLAALNYEKMMLGIPLYSDYYSLHDYIVQAKNAYFQTVMGMHNLAKYNIIIELRIVLHKLTYDRLPQLAKFIYKNLPFVEHVAFMGLENAGYTPYNIDKLWIDPYNYMDILREAVHFLDDFGLNVSIYNLQLCVLPRDLWKFARKSISDWKNIFVDECNSCEVKENCGGFFASCRDMKSSFIHPIKFEKEIINF